LQHLSQLSKSYLPLQLDGVAASPPAGQAAGGVGSGFSCCSTPCQLSAGWAVQGLGVLLGDTDAQQQQLMEQQLNEEELLAVHMRWVDDVSAALSIIAAVSEGH